MHDRWLVAISLAVAAAGITLLLCCLVFLDLPLSTINEAQTAADGAAISVRGEVRAIRTLGEDSTIITITQPSTMDIIAPNTVQNASKNPTLSQGDCVIVRGKKTTYNGNAQLSASRIQRC